jgi:hypothetical protein
MLLSFYFDMIPVLLAVYALYLLSGTQSSLINLLSKFSAITLIICQTTWIHSYINKFVMLNTFMDYIWTVFNTLTMLLIVAIAKANRNASR